jgi:hypothetical protein
MRGIASEISAVITARRKLLPEVQADVAAWRRAGEAVAALDLALMELCDYSATLREIVELLGRHRVSGVRPAITTVIEQLQRVEVRVSRNTLNIGVGGSVQAGKSTLLQSICGLDDTWLPTGSGIPVTAVRSLIYHTPGRRRAIVELHTFATFRSTHQQPRHAELGLTPAPRDVTQFRTWRYPKPDGSDVKSRPTRVLTELREMQESLPYYEGLLDRHGRILELSGDELDRLRHYVAYPTNDERTAGASKCRYLAVRDTRIECAFPRDGMDALGACDLPGLGEIAVAADRHHVAGLQYEVDFVLVVKRATEGQCR